MIHQNDTAPYCAFSPSSLPFERAGGRSPATSTGHGSAPFAGWPQRLLDLVFLWHERARERRELAALDSRMLADIGVDTATAADVANKPFWR